MTTSVLLTILTVLGGISLCLHAIQILYAIAPQLLSLRPKLWRMASEHAKVAAFRRRAVAAGVEDIVNRTAFLFERHLPKGWIRRAKIKWVRSKKNEHLSENELVLRVLPDMNSDKNLITALHAYFSNALFPTTRDMVPESIQSAIALAATRTSIETSHPYLLDEFDRMFLNQRDQLDSAVLGAYADCIRLNQHGFLLGPFIREVDEAAKQMRYHRNRSAFPDAIQSILDHMLSFQALTPHMPDDTWYFQGPCTSYGFSLISRPAAMRPGIDAYVERARQLLKRGVKRLYVIGRHEEREFVYRVIRELPRIRELRIFEMFPLLRDYRGDENGLGALLGVDEVLQKLDLQVRSLSTLEHAPAQSVPPLMPAPESAVAIERTESPSLRTTIEEIIVQLSDYEKEWIPLASVGSALRQRMPDFTPQQYGGRNLLSVVRDLPTLEFQFRGLGTEKHPYVRIRNGELAAESPEVETGYQDRDSGRAVEIQQAPDAASSTKQTGQITLRLLRSLRYATGTGRLSPRMASVPVMKLELLSAPAGLNTSDFEYQCHTGTVFDFPINIKYFTIGSTLPLGEYQFRYRAACLD